MGSHTMGLFAFGVAGTTVLITLFWRDVPYPRSIAVLGGVWAVIPQLVNEVPYLGRVRFGDRLETSTDDWFDRWTLRTRYA